MRSAASAALIAGLLVIAAALPQEASVRTIDADGWAALLATDPRCAVAAGTDALPYLVKALAAIYANEPDVSFAIVSDPSPVAGTILVERGGVTTELRMEDPIYSVREINARCGTSRLADGSLAPSSVRFAEAEEGVDLFADGKETIALARLADVIASFSDYGDRYFDAVYYRGLLERVRIAGREFLRSEIANRELGIRDPAQSVTLRRYLERNVVVARGIAVKLGVIEARPEDILGSEASKVPLPAVDAPADAAPAPDATPTPTPVPDATPAPNPDVTPTPDATPAIPAETPTPAPEAPLDPAVPTPDPLVP